MTTKYIRIGRLLHIWFDQIVQVNLAPLVQTDKQGRKFDSQTKDFDGPMMLHLHYLVGGVPMLASIALRDWLSARGLLDWLLGLAAAEREGQADVLVFPAAYDFGSIPDGV